MNYVPESTPFIPNFTLCSTIADQNSGKKAFVSLKENVRSHEIFPFLAGCWNNMPTVCSSPPARTNIGYTYARRICFSW